ncbi:MAG TPA: hypothetical protein VFP86_17150 [bacterium]|nr:hypothetical protein [bacterium]
MKGQAIALVLSIIVGMCVSVSTARSVSGTITAVNDVLSVAATPVRPQMLFEIGLVIENKSSNRVHLDPTRFVLVMDQRGQMNALNSEQAMP